MADRSNRFFPLTALVCLMAAGCSSIPFVGRGGDEGEVVAEDAENTDGRVPVLAITDELQPDPRFIGMLTAVQVPPAFANANWSQPGGEPDHVMHHLSAPETYSRAWSAKIGKKAKRAPVTAPPVVAENKVFTLDPEGRVSAFETSTGDMAWQQVLTPDLSEPARKFWNFSRIDPATRGFGGGVAYDSGWLYKANGFGRAASLNATTGDVRWEVELGAPVRNPPTAVDGKVFVVTMANQIIALDQNTGETLWSHESFEEAARILSSGSPAVDGDIVIAPFSSGEVVALDTDTGRLLWSATIARSSRLNALSTLNDIAGSPVIDRGGVFAVSHAGQLAA
ncbi:MAG: PQQ-binding-like beta-propeller repeat protein, partial [Pseudomonadota bacterium]